MTRHILPELLFFFLVISLSSCTPASRSGCDSSLDCGDCETCLDGACVIAEVKLNTCGECAEEPAEICGDLVDNDCDDFTDEGCNDPCMDVQCDTPPGEECIGTETLRVFVAAGICVKGECTYGYEDIPCEYGCLQGACIQLCAGITCDQPPGPCHAPIGECQDGVCIYPLEDGKDCDDQDACTFADSCLQGSCRGEKIRCEEPPPNQCVDADTMRSYASTGICQEGACVYGYQDVGCESGCEAGLCLGDPCLGVECLSPPGSCFISPGTCQEGVCHYPPDDGAQCDDGDACTGPDVCADGLCTGAGVVCDDPPADSCVEPQLLRTWSAPGFCEAGECLYVHSDIPCAYGCSEAACNPNPCLDVTCVDPPSDCHASPGTCAEGQCTYDFDDGRACDDAEPCTLDDVCTQGTCAGTALTCHNPPADYCIDEQTLRRYEDTGSCQAGECSYPYQDEQCPNSCADGQCQTCVPACDGKECGPDGCGDVCGECQTNEVCDAGLCVLVDPCADEYEIDDQPQSATYLSPAETQVHSICPAGDKDWWTFELGQVSVVTLETDGETGDTVMRLYDSALAEITTDDDGGNGLFSLIQERLNPGQYYVMVREYSEDEELDAYQISLTLCIPDCPPSSCGQPDGCGGYCHDCPDGQRCWYPDTDQDGFGDPSGAVCAATQPDEHTDNPDDCCDSDPDAHPGQEDYFDSASECGGFDYNCDGHESMRNSWIGGCGTTSGGHCVIYAFWYPDVPECGQPGQLVDSCDSGCNHPDGFTSDIQDCH